VKAWDGNGSMAEAAVAQSVASSLKALKTGKASLLHPNRVIQCY
jgi:hypothetical protein